MVGKITKEDLKVGDKIILVNDSEELKVIDLRDGINIDIIIVRSDDGLEFLVNTTDIAEIINPYKDFELTSAELEQIEADWDARSKKNKSVRDCECGAWATDFPKHHSKWCKLYKN